MYFNGDVVITDPCYVFASDHWSGICKEELPDGSLSLRPFLKKNFICQPTVWGDWSCTVFDKNNREKEYGEFTADAGMVAVMLLDDILRYDKAYKIKPDFKEWIENHRRCATVLKDFCGDIEYKVSEDGEHVYLEGTGTINFITAQEV